MTLQLAVKLSLDKQGFAPGAEEAARAVDDIGDAARRTAGDAAAMEAAVRDAGAAAVTAGRDATTGAAAQTTVVPLATRAVRAHGEAMRLTGAQATQLSYQLNDVFVSLASGMNPLTVAIQQGSQIAPVFGGVGGTLRAVASVLSPLRVGLGLVAGAGLLAAKAADDHARAMRDAATAAAGLGRNLGTSAGEIERIAQASAEAGGLSVAAARELATQFTATGKVGVQNFSDLITITKDFAATVGTDVASAGKMLAEIMADPARGAETLSRNYGLVDSAVERSVKRLAEQNKVFEAQSVLTRALKPNLVDAGNTVSWYERLWDKLTRTMSNYWSIAGQSLNPTGFGGMTAEQIEARIKQLQQPLPGVASRYAGADAARDAEVQRLQAELERVRGGEADRVRAGLDAGGRRGIGIADASQSSAVRDLQRVQQLKDEIGALATATTAPNLKPEEQQRIAAAIDAKTHALSTYITAQDRANQLAQIDVQLTLARTPAERAALEAKRARVEMAGQEVSSAEAAATAENAYKRAMAEGTAAAREALQAGRDRIEMLQAEIAAITQSEPQRARTLALLEAEQRIRREGFGGAAAAGIRAQAVATADFTTELERQRGAWQEIQTAGGSAIDTVVEGMRTGTNITKQLLDDLSKEMLKLAISNPLKNLLFGSSLPTASGVGGLLGSLFGGGSTTGAFSTTSHTGLFDVGGWTGNAAPHQISGLTHGQEFVVRAGPAARFRGLLEAINSGREPPGYAAGGMVVPRMAGAASATQPALYGAGGGSAVMQPVIQQTIENRTGAQISTREDNDGRGGRRQTIVIEEAIGDAVSRPRSATQKALKAAFGLQPRVVRR